MSRAIQRPQQSGGRSPVAMLIGLVAVALLAFFIHLGAGSTDAGAFWKLRLTPWEVLREMLTGPGGSDPDRHNAIIWTVRLPRALACLLAGGILGAVGSAFQALFKNPLADPYIVGVSSGSAVGGAFAISLGVGGYANGLALMAACFIGGCASLSLVFALAKTRGAVDIQKLLLAGVVVGSMLSAVLSLVLLAAGLDTNQVLRWLLGSATMANWKQDAVLALALIVGGVVLIAQSKRLNALAIGEDAAKRLGINTKAVKPTVLAIGTFMASVTVGAVGIIGFLGLVAPHIARRLIGVDWRWSLAASCFVGMSLLLLADVAAQRLVPAGELPVGVITALIGAPFLLALLRKSED